MPKLLIENIAKRIGKKTEEMSNLELRKIFMLIDWTLYLDLLEGKAERIPPSGNMPNDLLAEDLEEKEKAIAEAFIDPEFATLNKEKLATDELDDMFMLLGRKLNIIDYDIGDVSLSINDYKTLKYTDTLSYKAETSNTESSQVTQKLNAIYKQLLDKKVFSTPLDKILQIAPPNVNVPLQNMTPAKREITKNAPELLELYISLLEELNKLKKQNFKVENSLVKNICTQIKFVANNIVGNPDYDKKKLMDLRQKLEEMTPRDKRDPLHNAMTEALSRSMMQIPQMRMGMMTLKEAPKDRPIHRVILIGSEDLADSETMRVLRTFITNHPGENIVITDKESDVKKVNEQNKAAKIPFNLTIIGHGHKVEDPAAMEESANFNANLGPFRGKATVTGKQVADLVNQCDMIHHVKLVGCFTGFLQEGVKLERFNEKMREAGAKASEIRRVLTYETDEDFKEANTPFNRQTAAYACWNALDKSKRQIAMTVSPEIVESDTELSRMVWKGKHGTTGAGIKEIHVTTTQYAKPKQKMP